MRENSYHEPVMVREVIEALHIENQARYIDATVGTAGHSLEIVKMGGVVLGIDADKKMIEVAKKRLEKACLALNRSVESCFTLVNGNFRDVDTVAKESGFDKVYGVLFDLGVSNIHLKDGKRGFSFGSPDAALDMRLDPQKQGVRASDLLNALREDQLVELFSVTMNGFYAKRLAKRVVQRRKRGAFEVVSDLIDLCKGVGAKPGLRPATLPFLALRIAVNSELESLKEALPKAFDLLEKGGRLVVVSFHSGEDVVVKDFFKNKEKDGKGRILTEKPVQPNESEIKMNPRARSAKMRVIEIE